MKNVFCLRTYYEDGSDEVNGFFWKEESADKTLDFIKKNSPIEGDKSFKRGVITTMEVSDKTEKISDGETEWLIL